MTDLHSKLKQLCDEVIKKELESLEGDSDLWRDIIETYVRHGWDACLEALASLCIGEFDQMAAGRESLDQKDVTGDTGFIRGARWQFEQLAPVIAALKAKLAELEGVK